jgi:divalent metal cation (Fe/Co/Zn/Cd) transporter
MVTVRQRIVHGFGGLLAVGAHALGDFLFLLVVLILIVIIIFFLFVILWNGTVIVGLVIIFIVIERVELFIATYLERLPSDEVNWVLLNLLLGNRLHHGIEVFGRQAQEVE